MRKQLLSIKYLSVFMLLAGSLASCKKLVSIDEPGDSITAEKMYRNEVQAEGALTGIYNSMIHGTIAGNNEQLQAIFYSSFAAGLSTYAGGMSGGELFTSQQKTDDYAIAVNRLSLTNTGVTDKLWKSAYHTIYNANSVLEGLAASTSGLRDSVKVQFTAEAKFLRAFSYFQLVNYFGDIPLALTVDFNQTAFVRRTPVAGIYEQIIKDLKDTERDLPGDYTAGKGLRVRANKWAAKALLAKVYLYTGNNGEAAVKASELIQETALFQMETLDRVFVRDSHEAIFQLMQTNQNPFMGNATPEGSNFIPLDPHHQNATIWLTNEMVNSFEAGDQRKEKWTDSTLQDEPGGRNVKAWYPVKYKTGRYNAITGAASPEFYMVLRLAEMYLIRAEARANGADGGHLKAIEDLNLIRSRTDLDALPLNLDADAVKTAIAQERAIELFAEWGNRWMDLKRTGKASAVLSSIPAKQPWEGNHQLLYPIPPLEVKNNGNLGQNPGYIR